MAPRNRWPLLWALLIGSGGSACGYHLAARPPLPGGVDRVQVEILSNETSELELGSILSAALSRRAAREDRLAAGGGASTARLIGQVVRPRTGGVAFPPSLGGTGLYAQSLRLEVRLVSPGGKTLAQAKVSGSEPFEAGGGPERTESNRRRALERLAEHLADEAWTALVAAGS